MNQAPSGVKCHNHNFVIHNEVRQIKWFLGSRIISVCLLNTLNIILFLVKWSKRKDMDIKRRQNLFWPFMIPLSPCRNFDPDLTSTF